MNSRLMALAVVSVMALGCGVAQAQNWTTNRIGNSTYYNGSNGWNGYSNSIGNTQYDHFNGPNGQSTNCYSNTIGSTVYTHCN
jgi:hypothetical protein